MTKEQRGYFHSEVVRGFADGIDRLLVAIDHPPICLSDAEMKDLMKAGHGIESTERLSKAQVSEFINEIQALASSCMIYIATPEEWKRGIADQAREEFYEYVLQ